MICEKKIPLYYLHIWDFFGLMLLLKKTKKKLAIFVPRRIKKIKPKKKHRYENIPQIILSSLSDDEDR